MLKRLFIACVLSFLTVSVSPALAQKTEGGELFLPAEIPSGVTPPARLMQRLNRPVRINKALLDQAQPGQVVNMRLFNDTPLPLRLERREEHIPGTYSWVGQLTGTLDSLFIISIVKDAASLYLDLGSDTPINLQYLRDGVHLLYTTEPPTEFKCPTPPTTVRLPAPQGTGIRIQAISMIDTSICVSDQAVAELGGVNPAISKAINCVVYTNTACNNSNSQMQFNLYAVYQIPFDESGSSRTLLSRFAANSTANELLNRGALDVVGLLISNFPQADAAGIGDMPGRYTVSQIDGFTERTYAHEVGHNVGNGHEPGDFYTNDPDRDRGVYHYSAGYSFHSIAQYFMTIMSYGKGWTGLTIRHFMPYYSNPSVSFFASPGIGGATGIANDRDNARSMRDYGPTAAAVGTPGSNIYVDGSSPFGSNGSQLYPYHSVVDGINAVPNNGNVWVRGPRNYNERPFTGKPHFLRAWQDIVNIGRP